MMSHQNTTGELTVLQCACKRTRQLQRLHVSLDETIRTHFRILQEKNLSQSAQIQATRACMKLFLAFLEEEEANTISMQFDRALLLESPGATISGVLELMEIETEVFERGNAHWQMLRQQTSHGEHALVGLVGHCHQIWQNMVLGPGYLNTLIARVKAFEMETEALCSRLKRRLVSPALHSCVFNHRFSWTSLPLEMNHLGGSMTSATEPNTTAIRVSLPLRKREINTQ